MSATTSNYNNTQARILHVISSSDGPVVSATIKDRVDCVTRSAVEKQIESLVGRGLIEVVGEQHVGMPIPAKVYALTDAGEREVQQQDITPSPSDESDKETSGGGDVAAAVSSLTEQIEALREKLIEAHDRIGELEATVDAQAEALAECEARVDEAAEERKVMKETLGDRTRDLNDRLSRLESQ